MNAVKLVGRSASPPHSHFVIRAAAVGRDIKPPFSHLGWILTTFALLFLFHPPTPALCQPGAFDLLSFDRGNSETFKDIYAIPGDGFIACGSSGNYTSNPQYIPGVSYVIRIAADGRLIWERTYRLGESSLLESVIQTDAGDFILGGRCDNDFTAMRLDAEGGVVWQRRYGEGHCYAVIELKSGAFVLAGVGYRIGNTYEGLAVMTDADGEPLWTTYLTAGRFGHFYSVRETEGGVFLAGHGTPVNGRGVPWIAKIGFDEGELIWERRFDEIDGDRLSMFFGIASSQDGGFVACGSMLSGWLGCLLKVDADGEMQWFRKWNEERYGGSAFDITYGLDGGYYVAGRRVVQPGWEQPYAYAVTDEGIGRWLSIYEMENIPPFGIDRNQFHSVVALPNGEIWAAGQA
ncbi:MAG: hypothetical protein FJY67_10180, partial [Calditrichaeota bacterium]|nr:hypothetical protein [Calditrichota bacterium]